MSLLKQRPYTGRSAGHGRGVVAQNRLPLLCELFGISVPTSTRPITRLSGVAPAGWPIPRLTMLRSSATEESEMKVREKEPEDQPWIETILNERSGEAAARSSFMVRSLSHHSYRLWLPVNWRGSRLF